MAHHIYHTPGIVLRNRPRGEANALISVFSRELGLIEAQAQGLRLGKSKLRYSVQEFSVGNFEVVRGKHVWRLTNAVQEFNLYEGIKERRSLLLVVSRVFLLLTRLLSGEEANPLLFEVVTGLVDFVRINEFTELEVKSLEYLAVWRVLVYLGYGGEVPELAQFMGTEWNKALLEEMNTVASVARTEINRTLKETQL